MDFKELARVADTLDGKVKSVVSGQGLEVQESENPLDALEVKTRVQDTKQKVIILDGKKITSILDGPREERRKFLARLTDSQRRKVLQVYQDTKKIKDNNFSDKLFFVLLDENLSNFIYAPTEYNKQLLQEILQKNEYPEEIQNLVNYIIDDTFDLTLEDHSAAYDLYLDKLNELEIDSAVEKTLETMNISDSVKSKVSDSEINTTQMGEIASAAVADLDSWDGKDISTLNEASENSINKFVKKGLDYDKVSEAYWDVMNSEYGKRTTQLVEDHVKSTYGISIKEILDKKIIDEAVEEALNEINDNPFIDDNGDPVNPVEDTPVLTLLNEALTAFAEGDPSKLEELANQTISGEQKSEEGQDAKEENPDESGKDEDVDDIEVNEDDDLNIEDAARLAKAFLAGKNVNKVIDTLSSKVEALRIYNLKITDCEMCADIVPATSTIDVPLSCEEYNAIAPKQNICFETLLKQTQSPKCPWITDVWPTDDHLCIRVNSSQSYVPVGMSPDQVVKALEMIPREEWAAFIDEHCKPLSQVLELAAVTDNLNFIDNKFYKKHLKDSGWSFDQCPKVLEPLGLESGRLLICTDSSDLKDKTVVCLYGQNYVLE